MAQFRFKKNEVVFDIEGVTYSVPIERAQNAMSKLGLMQEEAAKAQNEEQIAALCEKIVGIIDDMITPGSCAAMFGSRSVSLFDLCDLVAYMAEEVTAFADVKKKEYGV